MFLSFWTLTENVLSKMSVKYTTQKHRSHCQNNNNYYFFTLDPFLRPRTKSGEQPARSFTSRLPPHFWLEPVGSGIVHLFYLLLILPYLTLYLTTLITSSYKVSFIVTLQSCVPWDQVSYSVFIWSAKKSYQKAMVGK